MKMQNRNRAMLLGVVGAYIIYLAYEMMKDELAGKSTMSMAVCILFVILLGGGGIACLILAWKIYRKKGAEEEKKPSEKEMDGLK